METKKTKPGNTEDNTVFDPEELEIMDRLAGKVVRWGMSVPAILFLESGKPLNFVASQLLHFFNPFVSIFIDGHQYGKFASLLEKRESIDELLKHIEKKEAERKKGGSKE